MMMKIFYTQLLFIMTTVLVGVINVGKGDNWQETDKKLTSAAIWQAVLLLPTALLWIWYR
jgi:hypothetical protein